jgi:hypothetical protein
MEDATAWARPLTHNEVQKLYRLGPGGIYERKIYVPYTQPTVEPAGSVGAFITSEVKPSYASGYASPITGGMAHESLWDGVVGAWCPSLGATGGTLRDLSGNHRHGTLTNMDPATDWQPEGLDFDGTSDYVTANFTGTGDEGTVSAWVTFDSLTAGTHAVFFSGGGTYVLINQIGSSVYWYWMTGSTTVQSSSVLETGKLYHLLMTRQNGVVSGYINGQLSASSTGGSTWTETTAQIGGWPGQSTRTVDGVVDDVLVYERPLTANEIAKLYRLGPAGLYQQKRPVITTVEPPTVEPAGSVGTFITSEVKPSYASGYASPITGGMAHESLWDGVVGAWCPSLGATGGTLRDLSGNHNHGTLTNAALSTVWQPDGLDLDGSDDHINLGDPASLRGMPNLTLAAWVKANDTGWRYAVFGAWGSSGANLKYLMRVDNGNIQTFIYTSTQIGGTFSTQDLTDRLHLLVATWDGATLKMYIDGVKSSTEFSGSGSIRDASVEDTYLGDDSGGSGNTFNGTIASATIYNRGITASDAAKLYRLGPAGLYQQKRPVITTAEEVVVGGLPIPIAAYHYNHNVGSRL